MSSSSEEEKKEEGIQNNVEVKKTFSQKATKLNTERTAYEVSFTGLDDIEDLQKFIPEAIQHVLDEIFEGIEDHDRVGIQIRHPGLDHPIPIPFRRLDQIDAETILRHMEDVQQSQTKFRLDDKMTWSVTKIGIPAGSALGGKRRTLSGNFDEWLSGKSGHGGSVIRIENNDDLCLARALVLAKCRIHKDESDEARKTYEIVLRGDKKRHTRQKKLAQDLMVEAGLQTHQGPCSLQELYKMHDTSSLRNYHIQVFSSETMLSRVYDEGSGRLISLLHHRKHFYVLSSLPSFFEQGYYCTNCHKAYNVKRQHARCGQRCGSCYELGECDFEKWVHCQYCNRYFFSDTCYKNHLKTTDGFTTKDNKRFKTQTSTCLKVIRCKCGETVHRDKGDHQCGKSKCHTCRKLVEQPHFCFMQPIGEKKAKPYSLIFYDMESRQEDVVGSTDYDNVFEHRVNLICAQKLCDRCVNDVSSQCSQCRTKRKLTFSGDKALDKFCTWLFQPVNSGSVAIAHNARGYDGQFILQWIHQQAREPSLINRGLEVIQLEYCGVRLLDSLNFLPMPLSGFPKSLGFSEQKGYFPHLFNRRENQHGAQNGLPDAWYYAPAQMKPAAREDFYKWYNEHKADYFDFQQELERYCHLDVDILAKGCLKFREILMKEQGVDPFDCAVTIASTCMHIFRKRFLKPETIAIVPHGGYRKHEAQSVKAIKWLKWLSGTENLDIQHARNGQEVKIEVNGTKYKADGQLRTDPKQLFEFYGCIYHGCCECFKNPLTKLPKSNMTASDALIHTKDRQAKLVAAGYKVRCIWECQLDRELAANHTMKTFFSTVQVCEPLDPRDGFYGGRTNCRKMYHKCKPDETIDYADVCSLYPWVCKYGTFPVGHPDRIITENFEAVTEVNRPYHGLIKCEVLPPTKLLHPVLPTRVNGKLLFHLCRTCADSRNNEECNHKADERMFWGTWATCEIYKALEKGYVITEIAEVYHYNTWEQFNPEAADSGLFTKYINAFLKTKQEASGWPQNITTYEEKQKYIRDYEEKEGIRLEEKKIEKNPGLRSLSKLCLNSFWGKFGQRSTLSKQEYFTEPLDYFKLVMDETNEVVNVDIINDCMVRVTYKKEDAYVRDTASTNSIIAAWVTAQARLKLYSYLEQLGDRVLYMDTDSVIYLTKITDHYAVPLGNYLGDMTDELDGSHIVEYVSCGPKQYAFKTSAGQTVVKVRGFTLDSISVKRLNLKSMKRLLFAWLERNCESVDIVSHQIHRTKDHCLVTRTFKKSYGVVYDKCRVLDSTLCVPFGYK